MIVSRSAEIDPAHAAWSPSGDRIAYMSAGQAVVVDLDGTNRQVVSQAISGFNGAYPEWSPDGQRIAFGAGDLEVIDRDGGNRHVVVHNGRTNFDVSWAPAAP